MCNKIILEFISTYVLKHSLQLFYDHIYEINIRVWFRILAQTIFIEHQNPSIVNDIELHNL